MRLRSRPSRLCAIAAAGSLVLAPIWPDAAWAQAAPPPPPAGQATAAPLNQVPPTRAGRLAQITGTVSFHAAEDAQWSPAVLNYPVTTGDSFWTEPQAQAALELSGNRFLMMSSTELDVTQLDDHAFAATLPQGEVCMALAFVPSGDTYAFQTPRGLVQIAATGNIAVVAGDTQNPTTVLVQNGAAQITGTNLSLQVGAGQMASISGADSFQGSVGPAPGPDPCLQQLLAPPAPVQTQATGAAPAPGAQVCQRRLRSGRSARWCQPALLARRLPGPYPPVPGRGPGRLGKERDRRAWDHLRQQSRANRFRSHLCEPRGVRPQRDRARVDDEHRDLGSAVSRTLSWRSPSFPRTRR